jgi:hypothetical protein
MATYPIDEATTVCLPDGTCPIEKNPLPFETAPCRVPWIKTWTPANGEILSTAYTLPSIVPSWAANEMLRIMNEKKSTGYFINASFYVSALSDLSRAKVFMACLTANTYCP